MRSAGVTGVRPGEAKPALGRLDLQATGARRHIEAGPHRPRGEDKTLGAPGQRPHSKLGPWGSAKRVRAHRQQPTAATLAGLWSLRRELSVCAVPAATQLSVVNPLQARDSWAPSNLTLLHKTQSDGKDREEMPTDGVAVRLTLA